MNYGNGDALLLIKSFCMTLVNQFLDLLSGGTIANKLLDFS